ncbi:MAG: hypothetical protein RBS24_06170 [Bacilli bacterium]|nr:hypothetical protein [Bacilli bacterium]
METYYVEELNDSNHTIRVTYVRARNPRYAAEEFVKAFNITPGLMAEYRNRGEYKYTYFKNMYMHLRTLCVTPSRSELADALYQITKTYTDGTCYESSNPYSKPHVQEALRVLARYAGTGEYLDALEKMEAIGHVYKFKQS